jgi:two-component system sensor histidine kinase SenX3
MSSSLLVLLSVGLGCAIGVLAVGSVVVARALGRRRVAAMHPEVPVAAVAVLDAHRGFAAILDASLTPVYANRAAREHESITGEILRAPEFLARAREVFTSGVMYTDDAEEESGAAIWLRVLRLGDRFLVVLAEDRGEEQRVNAMRRDFITNISHELKTPISAIGLLSEAVQEAADDPTMVRSFSKKLIKESRRLGELARDVIRLSEAQATLLPEQREEVDLRALVRHEIDEHRILAEERRVELVVTEERGTAKSSRAAEERSPAIMLGRPSALGIAVANLLSNAIEHSPPGGRVGVGLEREDGVLVVTVTDQGAGISAEQLPRVFERFFRVDDGRGRNEGGTGLGLSIVRHTMRSHGGDVDVWSQPGVGSSFSLTFPLTGAGDEAKAKRVQQTKRAAKAALQVVRADRQLPSPVSNEGSPS